MNRIDEAFSKAKETGQGALLPFVCAGSPEVDALTRLLPAMEMVAKCLLRNIHDSS